MKFKILAFLLACAWPAMVNAQLLINPYKVQAAGGGVTYLVEQDFEDAGTPAHWTSFNGTDFDYTATVLQGAQSLSIQGAGGGNAQYGETTGSLNDAEVWIRFRVRFIASAASSQVFELFGSGGEVVLGIYRTTAGVVSVYSDGAGGASPVNAMANSTDYYLWLRAKKGTGANAETELWFSTTSTKPANGSNFHALSTDGTNTANAHHMRWKNGGAGGQELIVDEVRVAATAFE